MTAFVALLRAVNVGRRKLAMADLRGIGHELGFRHPSTFIASGNLLFASDEAEATVARLLEERLEKHMSANVPVFVRTAREMAQIARSNPFSGEPGAKVAAIFLESAPPRHVVEETGGIADERLALGRREIYVHYPSGMGRSKLRLPARLVGTARNMNTVAKLAELAKEVE
ncbi:MAG TPA: DUF1697 domain-containing protein [Sphingomicrobium sp.]|nr:DUF1697 domain-containing protein [Sphingomicrobium sp.]